MNVSVNDKRTEAIRRMRKLGYPEPAVEAFTKDGTVMVSRAGSLEKLTPELKSAIDRLENEYNLLVYLAIDNHYAGCHMTSLLFVSDYIDEWESDDGDIEGGYALSYTINHDAEECSEFGSIGLSVRSGIPYRR